MTFCAPFLRVAKAAMHSILLKKHNFTIAASYLLLMNFISIAIS